MGDIGNGKVMVFHGLGGQLHFGGSFEARNASTGELAWREDFRTGVLSSPALADLDGDRELDVVFAEWWGALHARRASDGVPPWDADVKHLVWNSPALGDFNRDGRPDVVLSGYRVPGLQLETFKPGLNDKRSLDRSDAGVLGAYDGTTGRVLWERDVAATPGTPITVDLNGDGSADVLIVCTLGSSGILGRAGGRLAMLDGATGGDLGVVPLRGGAVGTPAVADLDGDGHLDVVVATLQPAEVVRVDLGIQESKAAWAWPRWRGNERGTGAGP